VVEPVGIFGGTFDPIHYGHLRTAYELLSALRLAEMRFLPAGNPPHRTGTFAPASLRLAMVAAAVADVEGFTVDAREVHKTTPSYTVETLAELRAELPASPLCLVVGMDAFLGLTGWYQWPRLLELAHLVVAHRPGWEAPREGELGALLRQRGAASAAELHDALAGRILVHAVTQLEISSTDMRALLAAGGDPRFLMPDAVRDVLVQSGFYARAFRQNPIPEIHPATRGNG
jgi:nicotinate-nucleotide adenylyltransferase